MLEAVSARLHLYRVPFVVPQKPRGKLHALQVPSLRVLRLAACARAACTDTILMLLETRPDRHDNGASSDKSVYGGAEPGRATGMDGDDAATLAQPHVTRHRGC